MKVKLYSMLLVAAAAVGCTSNDSDEPKIGSENLSNLNGQAELVLTEAESRTASAMQNFNVNLFRASCQAEAVDRNVVVSPLSASILLSMVANATSEEAAAEIFTALGTEDLPSLNSLSNKCILALPVADEAVILKFANAVWYQQGYSVVPGVAEVLASQFDADVIETQLQTNDPKVLAEINGWVEKSTEGRIKDIVTVLDPNTVALLADAFYFRGKLVEPFDVNETSKQPFAGVSGTSMTDMMHRAAMQLYAEGNGYEAVKLEMGKNNTFEAIFILPSEGVEINDFVASADINAIAADDFSPTNLDLSLPRFKMEPDAKIALDNVLKILGVNKIMTPHQLKLFDGVVESGFSISQKCSFEFDESGAEGASVTWSDICLSSGPGEMGDARKVAFDRPFLFLVKERSTGMNIFSGRVVSL